VDVTFKGPSHGAATRRVARTANGALTPKATAWAVNQGFHHTDHGVDVLLGICFLHPELGDVGAALSEAAMQGGPSRNAATVGW